MVFPGSLKRLPTVSVILPTHNRAWCVKKAIDSVLCQDYPEIELIVVDDGSTDHTRELLSGYAGRLKIIEIPHSGVSAARNRGIEAAGGELISFIDSDDRWLPSKITRQVEFFCNNPEILICQTQETWIRKGRRVNPKKRHKKKEGWIFVDSLALCLISPSAVMMRRELFDIIGNFDESLPACEDYDLWLRTTSRFPVGLIEDPLVVKYGGHTDQLSAMPGLDRFRIISIKNILERILLPDTWAKAAARTLCMKCDIYASGCEKRKKFGEASYYRNIAKRFTPFA